jgi:hypothetical protein
MNRQQKAMLSLLCGLALACGRNNDRIPGQPAASDEVVVNVENNHWQEVNIYAERNGSRTRLGTVITGKAASFVLPRDYQLSSDLRIRVDPIGEPREYVSPAILVNPGAVVQVRISNALNQTVVTVR